MTHCLYDGFASYFSGTNATHGVVMCLGPSPGQKVKCQGQTGHSKLVVCSLCRSGPICTYLPDFCFICGTNITHQVMMLFGCHFPSTMSGKGHMGCTKFLPKASFGPEGTSSVKVVGTLCGTHLLVYGRWRKKKRGRGSKVDVWAKIGSKIDYFP